MKTIHQMKRFIKSTEVLCYVFVNSISSNNETNKNFVPDGTTLRITIPDDFHHHFREGSRTKSVLIHTTKRFRRAIAMPNIIPPITTTEAALQYRDHILNSLPKSAIEFEPLMTLYLTDNTSPEEIYKACQTGFIHAVKYYPSGATTNSDFGVSDVKKTYPALKAMEKCGMVLCIHSEVSRYFVDIFDREKVFIHEVMKPLIKHFPHLRIVMEHISTKDAVDFLHYCVKNKNINVRGSITAHHLLYNRNSLLAGGIKPHFYCLPVLKRESHREYLIKAATSGSSLFFAGTDSAPHSTKSKQSSCGCAGVYTAHAAVELYAEAFEEMGALDKLEPFLSHYGADFYGLPRNKEKITMIKRSWTVPKCYKFGEDTVTPLRANEDIHWSLVE